MDKIYTAQIKKNLTVRASNTLSLSLLISSLAVSAFFGNTNLAIAQQESNPFLYLLRGAVEGAASGIGEEGVRQTIQLFQNGSNNRAGSEASLTREEAVNVIKVYLTAKNRIFRNPYDTDLLKLITTGRKLEDSVGAVSWLRNNDAYYTYTGQSVDVVKHFQSDTNLAVIEAVITEKRNYYVRGNLDNSLSKWDTDVYQYVISRENGKWRIEHAISL